MNNIATRSRQRWNKGKLVGQKPPLRLRSTWAIRVRLQIAEKNSGSGSLRSGHRQQASSLRLNQAPRARRCPWRVRIITSHGDAAENAAGSAVRDH